MPTEYIIQIAQQISRKSNFQFVSVENVWFCRKLYLHFKWWRCIIYEWTGIWINASLLKGHLNRLPGFLLDFSIGGLHFIYRNIFQFKTFQPKLTPLVMFVVLTCVSLALHPFALCPPLALHPSFFHWFSRFLSVCRSSLRVWYLRQHHTANISNSKQCFIPTPRIINILQAYFWF